MANGNGTVKWWLPVAVLVTILISVLTFMGNKIYANTVNVNGAKECLKDSDHAIEMRILARHEAIMAHLTAMDKRVVRIESNRFTASDAQRLTELIMEKLPPKWLVDKVEENETNIKDLQKKRR